MAQRLCAPSRNVVSRIRTAISDLPRVCDCRADYISHADIIATALMRYDWAELRGMVSKMPAVNINRRFGPDALYTGSRWWRKDSAAAHTAPMSPARSPSWLGAIVTGREKRVGRTRCT